MTTSTEENKAIVRRWQEVVLEQRRFDLLDEVIHPDYVMHDANIHGREEARALFTEWYANGPAAEFSNLDMFGQDDKIVSRWMRVVSDKRYKGISIFRIAEGKIIEDWGLEEEIKPA